MGFLYRLEDSWGEVEPRKFGPHDSSSSSSQSSSKTGSSSSSLPSSASRLIDDITADESESVRSRSKTSPQDSGPDSSATDFPDADDTHVRAHWALLLAGSAGWGNYRHQADVLHAYQVKFTRRITCQGVVCHPIHSNSWGLVSIPIKHIILVRCVIGGLPRRRFSITNCEGFSFRSVN